MSLRGFLDNGGDPRDVLGSGLRILFETAYYQVPTTAPIARKRQVQVYREHVAETLALGLPRLGIGAWPSAENFAQYLSWVADLYEDPSLIERVIAFATPEEHAYWLKTADEYKRPHPLRVDVYGHWQCESCGAPHDEGSEAVIVGFRKGHSDLEYEILFCRDCIAMALAALDATEPAPAT